jgi:hypothetical protein
MRSPQAARQCSEIPGRAWNQEDGTLPGTSKVPGKYDDALEKKKLWHARLCLDRQPSTIHKPRQSLVFFFDRRSNAAGFQAEPGTRRKPGGNQEETRRNQEDFI